MPEKKRKSSFVLCSQAASGLGWPESVHDSREEAEDAAAGGVGEPMEWRPDPQDADTWHTAFPHEWMIRRVPS